MEWDEDVWKDAYALVYRCWLSRIYHLKRERFFDLCDSLTKTLALIAGAASIAKIFNPDQLLIFGVLITITSALSLVVGYAKKARCHADFAKTFIVTEAKIVEAGVLSREQVDALHAEVIRLEMNEPRTLGALVRICQNEIAVARGNKQDIRPVPFFKRLLAHFYDWELAP